MLFKNIVFLIFLSIINYILSLLFFFAFYKSYFLLLFLALYGTNKYYKFTNLRLFFICTLLMILFINLDVYDEIVLNLLITFNLISTIPQIENLIFYPLLVIHITLVIFFISKNLSLIINTHK